MEELNNPIQFSAFLTSLQKSVNDSILFLEKMLEEDKSEIFINDKISKDIISLLMYDSLINKEANYSLLDDFDFTKEGRVILKDKDKEQVKTNLKFMQEYLSYRIEYPIDLASC